MAIDSLRDRLPHLDLSDSCIREMDDCHTVSENPDITLHSVLRGVDGILIDVAIKRARRQQELEVRSIPLVYAGQKVTRRSQLLLEDMQKWSSLSHRNLEKFEGYIFKDNILCFVSIWIEGKTVIEYVENNSYPDLVAIVSKSSASRDV